MQTIKFRYRDAEGRESIRILIHWSENTRYIQGRGADDSLPRTYRKDRIVDYLDGGEHLLNEQAPLAPEPAPRAEPDKRVQILFTGFKAADRAALESMVEQQGFRVMKNAGKSLAVLCIGANAGPSKVEAARVAGAFIVTESELRHLIETGEIPC